MYVPGMVQDDKQLSFHYRSHSVMCTYSCDCSYNTDFNKWLYNYSYLFGVGVLGVSDEETYMNEQTKLNDMIY